MDGWGFIPNPTTAKRSESHLLGLVDTPGPLAGFPAKPQLRWGVSKARKSFAYERIRYWVSDPITLDRHGWKFVSEPRAPELLVEPPRRAKRFT